jgi:hypothetical protein
LQSLNLKHTTAHKLQLLLELTKKVRSIPQLGSPETYGELTSFEILGQISMTLFGDRSLGPQNVVETDLGSKELLTET